MLHTEYSTQRQKGEGLRLGILVYSTRKSPFYITYCTEDDVCIDVEMFPEYLAGVFS